MHRRTFMELLAAAGAGSLFPGGLSGIETADPPDDKKLIGMYVHQAWVYNHPYAARTWTDDNWRGYLDGLHRLGYNLVSIWPLLETMPHPLMPSDQAKLEQHRRVIDMAHREFGMKVWIVLCPNLVANDAYARLTTFEKRSYYGSFINVNPADSQAMDAMMARCESLLKPLAEMDGVVIIDSDPGGYPNSTNQEFVDLLIRHRRLLDRLRPGAIELIYWSWVGWQAYGRYHATGEFAWGTEPEFLETLGLLKEKNLEPWGLARGLEYAQKLGLESKVIHFHYGAIEGEPNFPMTNFGPRAGVDPYQAGRTLAPRGAQANAQTHCIQLPGTFAFAQGAKGLPLTDQDYVLFADDLVQGQGKRIVSAWKALAGLDREAMLQSAAELAPLVKARLEPGPLKGLLFGDANRFLSDLYVMLRLKAACLDFIQAADKNQPLFQPLEEFVSWLDRWHVITGYKSWWNWTAGGDINQSLKKLDTPLLTDFVRDVGSIDRKTGAGTPMERIYAGYYRAETETLRLIQALKQTLWEMDPRWPDSSTRFIPQQAPASKP
ncbi:MAG: hypothetical protein JXB10_06545 [Pirellulales bacterium]|nr:hypothetical protein [Pirellulales bacterium]